MTTTEPDVRKRIWIFDTTLRDGEQSPGATMTVEEKLEVADALVELGVDIIEAGFPAASPGDFEAVKMIAQRVKGARVAGLARTNRSDIEQCARAIEPAEHVANPHIYRHVGYSPRAQIADESRGGARAGVRNGFPGQIVY